MIKKFLPLFLVFCWLLGNVQTALAATSYEEERKSYLQFIKAIVYDAMHSGIDGNVKLTGKHTKEQENVLDKLKKDILKSIDILEKDRVKVKNYKLENEKLIKTNAKVIDSVDTSIKAFKGLHQSICDYDIIQFIRSFQELKTGDKMLHNALEEINGGFVFQDNK